MLFPGLPSLALLRLRLCCCLTLFFNMLAIVLGRKNLREYDQMVSLYAREHGKLDVLAKGIKKITSKNSANLEILSLVEAEVAEGKEIYYLTKVQSVKFFKNIYADLDKIVLAGYVVKMADINILPRESDKKIFNLLTSFLEFLESAHKINSLNLAIGFIFKLWHCLGFSAQGEERRFWLEWSWPAINELNLSNYEQLKTREAVENFAIFNGGKIVFAWPVADSACAIWR
jgi:hypothetical protein